MKMICKRATHGLLRDPLGRAREAVRQRQPRGGIVVHSKFSLLIQNGILQRHFKVCRNWRPAFRSSPLGKPNAATRVRGNTSCYIRASYRPRQTVRAV